MHDIKDIKKSMCEHIDELNEAVQNLNILIKIKREKNNANN
jgi:hypothetical protein